VTDAGRKPDRAPTILAMGGGGFTSPAGDPALDELVLELCGRREPRILFLPTASGDPNEQIAAFHTTYGRRAALATVLSLFRRQGDPRSLREIVLAHDVVYVGGGSLRNLLAIWAAHGLDEVLREAWERGVVLAGLSAGAMCWFQGGCTKSFGPPEANRGLGFLPGSLTVHADGEPERLPVWLEAVRTGQLPGGWAADDGVGLVFEGTELMRVVSARPGTSALRVDAVGGELVRTRLEPELLGAGPLNRRPLPDDIKEWRRTRYGPG
jgi:dipeptidase E